MSVVPRQLSYLARSPLDNFLSALGGAMATYSLGMSLGKPLLAQVLATGVLVASVIGYLLSHALRKTQIIKYDGWIITFVALALFFLTGPINSALGDEGLPFNIIAGVFLSFLVVLGNLVSWRDSTMLFLSLPSVSLFAYAGMFGGWQPAILLFFVFLISVAVLYARSYLRVMVEKAEERGAEAHLLRRDVWKWVAGPEWAFASAAVVIVISMMVGPLLQISLSPVSGAVKIQSPSPQNAARTSGLTSEVRVGMGPVVLSDTPIFKVKSTDGVYFRKSSFFDYNGDGWNASNNSLNINSLLVASADPKGGTFIQGSQPSPYEPINIPKSTKFQIQIIDQTLRALPEPGVFTHVDANLMDLVLDRTSIDISALRKADPVSFDADLPSESAEGKRATVPGPYPSKSPVVMPKSVTDLASEAVKGAVSDYLKCQAISKFVGARCSYDTSASAVPLGKDKIDYFLNESKTGYCDLFASAFVMMARTQGIQARYLVGWHCEQNRPPDAEGYRVVIEKDSHTWAEVYFAGVGWIPFDPTEYAVDVGPGKGSANKHKKASEIPWDKILTGVFAAAAVVTGTVFLRGAWYKKLLRSDPISQLVREQNKLQFAVEETVKHPRRFSQSITEFISNNESKLGSVGLPASALARTFESAFFSGQDFPAAQVVAVRAETAKVVKRLAEVKKKR